MLRESYRFSSQLWGTHLWASCFFTPFTGVQVCQSKYKLHIRNPDVESYRMVYKWVESEGVGRGGGLRIFWGVSRILLGHFHEMLNIFLEPWAQARTISYNGLNDYNGGWPSARLFGWSAADWSRPATNKFISSEREKNSIVLLRKEIMNKLVVDLLQQKGLGCWKVLE
jgi:hypothetical protein